MKLCHYKDKAKEAANTWLRKKRYENQGACELFTLKELITRKWDYIDHTRNSSWANRPHTRDYYVSLRYTAKTTASNQCAIFIRDTYKRIRCVVPLVPSPLKSR